METPSYSTKPNLSRILIPRIIKLLLLSALLYLGVRINYIVFGAEFPGIINLIVVILILVLIAADIFLAHMKNKENKIYFFNDRIEIRGKNHNTINLALVSNAEVKMNMLDKMLNTGDIKLNNGEKIKNLNYPERIRQYILQLIRRSPQIKKNI